MKPSWHLLEKIISGQKTIESRWYKNKSAPWGKISMGDTVFFKNSGQPVTLKAFVSHVLSFPDLTPQKVKEILDKYGRQDGISLDQISAFYQLFKDKRYCLLIFLQNPQLIPPFDIDKTGFGSQSAWITIENINQIIMF
jgi:ASC-1-like (ASCH) protein